MWVRFLSAFDWTPPKVRRITMAYPAGFSGQVTHDCAAAAIAAGKAEQIDAPPREDRKPLPLAAPTDKRKRPGG